MTTSAPVVATSDTISKARTYTLLYRFGPFGNGNVQTLHFEHSGDLRSATERVSAHCLRMNYKLLACQPFIVDLDAREQLRNDRT